MRPAFGILRHVERRASNAQITERDQNGNTTRTTTIYAVMVTRVVILWLTVWTHEAETDLSS